MSEPFDRAEATDRILREILENPTAPFREDAVLAALDRAASALGASVEARADRAGNRIWRVRGAKAAKATPTICFTAHLDHPALVPDASGRFELLGRVWPVKRLEGGKVRFHRRDGADAGRGVVTKVEEEGGRAFAELRREGAGGLSGVDYATFDFPALAFEGDRIVGRVCDDLLGAIAIRIAIEECLATMPKACFLAAFTRAEEVGFVGALAMLEEPTIPREVPIVGLECSAARGGNAIVGDGPIVRVGDRIATFDPGVSAFLRDCAEALAADGSGFRYQRKLMQGGACESTAYLLDGRRAGALCLALGNYHNIPDAGPDDPSTGLAPEHVSRRDLEALARLIAKAVERSALLADPWMPTKTSLAKRLEEWRPRL
jgi:endoglucanase